MKVFELLPAEIESLAKQTVDASIKVHRALGPGLLESVYETCLAHELRQRRLKVETQVMIPVVYDRVCLEAGLRLNLLINKQLIVEVKAVEQMNRNFKAQVLTYLKLANLKFLSGLCVLVVRMSALPPTILRFESIDSTNLEAMRQARAGAPEGLSVIAREQKAGR